jgi:hypothetical protein
MCTSIPLPWYFAIIIAGVVSLAASMIASPIFQGIINWSGGKSFFTQKEYEAKKKEFFGLWNWPWKGWWRILATIIGTLIITTYMLM